MNKLFLVTCLPGLLLAGPIVMLSPNGDTSNPGRTLADGFERGVTRQLAEHVKNYLQANTSTNVFFTHDVGQQITHEQKIALSNTNHVDLFIAFGAYSAQKLTINTYFYKNTHPACALGYELMFCPLSATQQHTPSQSLIPATFHKQFLVTKAIGAPLKVLEGIKAQAYYFEIGVTTNTDISAFALCLGEAIRNIL